MKTTLAYLPGALHQQVANKIVELGKLIRNDINRYLRYINTDEKPPNIVMPKKTQLLINKTRQRILSRLEKVAKMQVEQRLTSEEFEDILRLALEKVDKHSPDFHKKLEILRASFNGDITKSKILFIQSFMRIVARIPASKINSPFHQ